MANNEKGGSFMIGFLMGGIIGAIVGILLAPRSGSETRTDLTERSGIWRTRAEGLAATLRERVGPTVDTARERIAPTIESVRDRVGPTIENVRGRVPIGRSTDGADGGETVKVEESETGA